MGQNALGNYYYSTLPSWLAWTDGVVYSQSKGRLAKGLKQWVEERPEKGDSYETVGR
ncbi:MAG: hypothetical protein NPIRA03_07730 [Nitrospirales bacterium]|nr:MAG: hypothetical protein NPIRA03_07730 [Nitrospirales bacterium]